MGKLMIVLIIGLIGLFACGKQAPTTTLDEMVDTSAMLKYSGEFISGPYGKVSGTAQVFLHNNMFEVKLSNFLTTNGPALHVFISKEAMPINFIDLGGLKSTNGNQVYSVKDMPDFASYKFISIHCVDYNHLFGSAELFK